MVYAKRATRARPAARPAPGRNGDAASTIASGGLSLDDHGAHIEARADRRSFPSRLAALDKSRSAFYKPGHIASARAQVAQLVEHATENRSVGGSIPPLGTIA